MLRTLLVIEDEALLAQEIERHFRRDRWRVITATTLKEARRLLGEQDIAPLVVVSDMSLPDGNALDLLDELGVGDSEWIFLTGYGTVADSVRALQLGAFDFLEKPVDFSRLDLVVTGAARSARANRRLHDETVQASQRYSPESFVGSSQAAREVRELLTRLSTAPFRTLTITGETGTGKGVAARILHHSGTRSQGPLIEVNCSALPKDLMESELFGHEAGSFTGAKGRRRGLMEQADGGTLFLDEIGEMPLDLQTKTLKAIEEQSFRRVGGEHEIAVDVQVIAASNRDLALGIRSGTFREDLYHRLSVFHLHLPPLRERLEDLDILVPMLIHEFNAKAGRSVRFVPEAVWERLRAHKWSGNVRELRNVIERCVMFAQNDELPLKWLQLEAADAYGEQIEGAVTASEGPSVAADTGWIRLALDGSMSLEAMDRAIILAMLERQHYNVAATARILDTTRDTLRYRIKKYGITNDTSDVSSGSDGSDQNPVDG
ncbi:MAG: sigma-54 dependent transcriptional regulator [Chromatiales bacterium]|jgi:DNA-binding NtrC family response regulator|nr:sigma-54 dependent transcriptional regulator [Chromatiales bacterium]